MTGRKDLIDSKFSEIFDASPALYVQAPGRVDLMGSHTDYNLGFVLTQAIDRNTWIAARPRHDRKVRVLSLNLNGRVEFDLEKITFDEKHPWSNYVRGVADVLQKEGYELTGFDGLIHSTIPFGSGLSSSAALEVSTAVLFESLANWKLDPVRRAVLCQRAENEFVGLNCGILDQYSSSIGGRGSVLLLDCRSITSETRPMASGLQVMICDTRAKRELTGSEYSERRAQCEAGVRALKKHYPQIGSLRDVKMEQLETHKTDIDPVVYKRCLFILQENQRVLDTADALSARDHPRVGRLAVESFEGARDLYEIVSKEMSAMHDAILSAPGVYGARGAGAGFGGCLVAFVREEDTTAFVEHVQAQYVKATRIESDVYPVQAAEGAARLSF